MSNGELVEDAVEGDQDQVSDVGELAVAGRRCGEGEPVEETMERPWRRAAALEAASGAGADRSCDRSELGFPGLGTND